MNSGFEIYPLKQIPSQLKVIDSPPNTLFYTGNTSLLEISPKVAIVGTRHPNHYAKTITALLAREIQKAGGIVVSGGALGIDIIAHQNSLPQTILISPASLDIIYPAFNAKTIKQVAQNGLILSEYKHSQTPKAYDFLHRNRLVVGLSDVVIIPQADLQSGSMSSARFCINQNKPLYVLPHHIGESEGTQSLLEQGKAKCIYNIKHFLESIGFGTESSADSSTESKDEILEFCKSNPSFEEAMLRFGDVILEYELEGRISRQNGRLIVAN